MNKLVSAILIVMMMSFIGGCSRILSPEELISPPELNVEKKEVKDAITKFLPQNSELFPFTNTKDNRESSFGLKDLNDDKNNEIVAIYRDKTTFKIGILVLKNEFGLWVKKGDISLDGTDVSDYLIDDLDKDGLLEIIVGYESRQDSARKLDVFTSVDDGVIQIFDTDYYSLSIDDITGDDGKELVIASVATEKNDNEVLVYSKKDKSMIKNNSIIYPIGTEPYNIKLGKLTDNKEAIFVDLYVDNSYGKCDVLVYEKNLLYSIMDGQEAISYQENPTQSTDIDRDGIIEVGNTSEAPVYKKNYGIEEDNDYKKLIESDLMVRNYYKYIDKSFVKVKEYFDEPTMNISIDIPEIIWKKYVADVKYENEDSVLTLYYSPNKNHSIKNAIIEVRLVAKNKMEKMKDYQMISETEDYVVLAKQVSDANGLAGEYFNEYQKVLEDTKNITGIVSQYIF
ncbi:MAG: hypothetical protein ACRDA4_06170 [Filifactoraceae bacterium]